MTDILGYAAAVVIGATLGLIGGGGSILTVPTLVYLLNISPVAATAYSLFIVGLSALVGAVAYMRRGMVSYRAAAVFALPSFLTVFLTRRFIVPAVPETLFAAGDATLTKDLAVMLLFALLLIASSVAMIRRRSGDPGAEADDRAEPQFSYTRILLQGVALGVLSGLVGAGGGFLIIPALVLLARLPMKIAVGTSLLVIATNSLIGFTGDIGTTAIRWDFLAVFAALTVGGILLGAWISAFVPGAKLRPAFGWFTLAMGAFILGKELFIH